MARGAGKGNRGRKEGGGRRQSARQRGSEDLLSAPATPAPCLVLRSCPIPLPDALPMLRGGLEVRAPPFSLTGWAPGPPHKTRPPTDGRTGLGSGLREGAGNRGQFTRRVTTSVHGLGPREPMARTRTLRQLPTARSLHGHEHGHSWGCFPDFMVMSEGKRGFPGLGSDRKMTLSCSGSDGSVTVAIPVSGASAE